MPNFQSIGLSNIIQGIYILHKILSHFLVQLIKVMSKRGPQPYGMWLYVAYVWQIVATMVHQSISQIASVPSDTLYLYHAGNKHKERSIKQNKADSQLFIKVNEDAIAKSGKINRRLARSIVIGPTGSGKSFAEHIQVRPLQEVSKESCLSFTSKQETCCHYCHAGSVTAIIENYGFETFRNYLQKTFSLYLRDTGIFYMYVGLECQLQILEPCFDSQQM